jgi:hypothetical protein
MVLLLQNTFMVQGTAKQESTKDFIMQNCSVKWLQAGKILQCKTAFCRSGRE